MHVLYRRVFSDVNISSGIKDAHLFLHGTEWPKWVDVPSGNCLLTPSLIDFDTVGSTTGCKTRLILNRKLSVFLVSGHLYVPIYIGLPCSDATATHCLLLQ